jgi:hypothetical protein
MGMRQPEARLICWPGVDRRTLNFEPVLYTAWIEARRTPCRSRRAPNVELIASNGGVG